MIPNFKIGIFNINFWSRQISHLIGFTKNMKFSSNILHRHDFFLEMILYKRPFWRKKSLQLHSHPFGDFFCRCHFIIENIMNVYVGHGCHISAQISKLRR